MAEYLNLENFDTKNFKANCCFHNENTPSLIYNPKNYRFHCFGCSKTIDIIDVFMMNKMTSIEAVQKLFEIADIKYSFGEHKVKTKREYKYPKEVITQTRDDVDKYLGLRKISKETIDYLDIRQDENSNIVFNFYDINDVLTMVKYRPARKIQKPNPKCWCQPDADTSPLLFNMNRINTEMPLIICEGEIDCASLIECGFANSVSVPLGAGNTQWVNENWNWLQTFNQIIICADNDDAGNKLQKDIVYRLGSWRTKYVNIPNVLDLGNKKQKVKDINEVLFYAGKEKVRELIINASDTPIDSVVDFSDIKDVDLNELDGIHLGIEELDKKLMKIPYGSFNIITGVNSSGKSSFLSQVICNTLEQGEDIWLYSKELPNFMSKNWINYVLAGQYNLDKYTYNEEIYYKVNNETKQEIDKFYRGRIQIYKDEWDNSIDSILQSMEDSTRKFGSKLLIVDNLTAVDLGGNSSDKWDNQTEFIKKLINFSKRFNVVVFLVIHPHKMDMVRRMNIMDVQGSMSMSDLAHRCFSLYRVSEQDKKGVPKSNGEGFIKEPIKFDVLIDVLKDRFTGKNGLSVGLYYDNKSRRFFTNRKEYLYKYSWDKKTYNEEEEGNYPINEPY